MKVPLDILQYIEQIAENYSVFIGFLSVQNIRIDGFASILMSQTECECEAPFVLTRMCILNEVTRVNEAGSTVDGKTKVL